MFMTGSSQFLVSMVFSGRDQVSPEIKKIAQEAKALKDQVNSINKTGGQKFQWIDQMNTGLKTASKYLDDMKSKLDNMKSSGFGNMVTGGAMLAPIMNALDAAGKMQTKMITISSATGATDTKGIQDAVKAASNVTKFSTLQVADLAVKLATSGMTATQVQQLTPIVAKFAEVQSYGKGSAPDEAVTQAVSAAHMLGIYDPKQLDKYLNTFNKATFMTPGSTSEFFDTFKYLAPTAKGLGMSNDDVLYTAALSNRVGLLGSMGGTEAADMVLRSIPGIFGGQGHVDKNGNFKPSQQLKAMMDLGLAKADGSSVFFNKKGQFQGIQNFIDQLANSAKNVNPEQLMKDFKNMFGMQGEKLAVLFSQRGGEQLQIIKKQMDSMSSYTQIQDDLNKSFQGQKDQLTTNLQNLNVEIGNALLPSATRLMNVMQPYVMSAESWVKNHKDEVATIAKVTGELGLLLVALGASKVVLGTIGKVVLDPLAAGVKSLIPIFDNLKAQKAALSTKLPETTMQANIVNVYGTEVNGIGGGSSVSVPDKGKPTILGPNGKPIETTGPTTITSIPNEAKQVAKSSTVTNMAKTGFSVAKGMVSRGKAILPVSIALGAYDVATAPEGHKVETAVKTSGSVIGGWAGAEAGAAMGAAIGSVVPGIGTAIGGVLGGIIGGIAGSTLASSLTDSLMGWMNHNQPSSSAGSVFYSQQTSKLFPAGQIGPSFTDNSTHHYDIKSTDPHATAQEIHGMHQNRTDSRLGWLLSNSE